MSCEMLCMLCVLCYVLYALYDCFSCFCQRTEKCARIRHVFASVCSQVMKGRGGVGGGHVNVPCTSSASCCYAAQMSGSVASLYTCCFAEYMHVYIYICESAYPSPAKTNSTLKRLLWKEGKKKPVNMPQWNESKTHTKRESCQILAREFGTIRLAEMSVSLWQKWFVLEKRCFYEHSFRSAGMYAQVYLYVHICVYYIIYLYILITIIMIIIIIILIVIVRSFYIVVIAIIAIII
jgi:hypothetical protein